jgi:hypothetical protein
MRNGWTNVPTHPAIDVVTLRRTRREGSAPMSSTVRRGNPCRVHFILWVAVAVLTSTALRAQAPAETTDAIAHAAPRTDNFNDSHFHLTNYIQRGLAAVVSDQFERHPWEAGGGLNYYPGHHRSWRVNLHLLHIDKSPASSSFGYYQAGQTGTIFSLGVDILL